MIRSVGISTAYAFWGVIAIRFCMAKTFATKTLNWLVISPGLFNFNFCIIELVDAKYFFIINICLQVNEEERERFFGDTLENICNITSRVSEGCEFVFNFGNWGRVVKISDDYSKALSCFSW